MGQYNNTKFKKWHTGKLTFTFQSIDGKIKHSWSLEMASTGWWDPVNAYALDWQSCKKSIPSLKIPAGQYEIIVKPGDVNLKGHKELGQYSLGISSSRPVTAKLMTSAEIAANKAKYAEYAMVKKGVTCDYVDGDGNMSKLKYPSTMADAVKAAKAQKAKGIACDVFAYEPELKNWWDRMWCCGTRPLNQGKTSWTGGTVSTFKLKTPMKGNPAVSAAAKNVKPTTAGVGKQIRPVAATDPLPDKK